MRTPDYFDRADADEQDEDASVVCSRCSATGLHWQRVWGGDGRERPVLFEGARRHECRAATDDFDDVSGAGNA